MCKEIGRNAWLGPALPLRVTRGCSCGSAHLTLRHQRWARNRAGGPGAVSESDHGQYLVSKPAGLLGGYCMHLFIQAL